MTRKLITITLIGAGVFWSIMFPKKASLDPDMVSSTCFGIGLIGSGLIVFLMRRSGRVTPILSLVLLWSLLGNACLFSMNEAYVRLLRGLAPRNGASPTGELDSEKPRTPHGR